jgi:hypothetical protein
MSDLTSEDEARLRRNRRLFTLGTALLVPVTLALTALPSPWRFSAFVGATLFWASATALWASRRQP